MNPNLLLGAELLLTGSSVKPTMLCLLAKCGTDDFCASKRRKLGSLVPVTGLPSLV